ncbi:MAG: hypothetical protein HPY71_14190 [Firmicutes bacterium]|nr:hypothetical protein [Bacillota bacterium]
MGFLMEIERLAEGQQGLRVVCQQPEGAKREEIVRPGEHKLFGVAYWTNGSASFARILEDLQEDRVTDGSYLIVAVDDVVSIVSDPLGTIPAFYHVGDSSIVIGLNMSEVA